MLVTILVSDNLKTPFYKHSHTVPQFLPCPLISSSLSCMAKPFTYMQHRRSQKMTPAKNGRFYFYNHHVQCVSLSCIRRRFSLKTLTALNCLLNYAQVCVAGSKLPHRVDATFKLFYRATIMVVTAKGASVSEAVGCFAQQAPRSNEG